MTANRIRHSCCQPPQPSRCLADSRGYTLQALVVSTILVLAAAGASVILYRVFTGSSDVRSLADLSSETSPGRPSGFAVEPVPVPPSNWLAPRISWSPPVQIQDSAASPVENYRIVAYTCDYKSGTNDWILRVDPMADVADFSTTQPVFEFPTAMADITDSFVLPDDPNNSGNEDITILTEQQGYIGDCLIRVRAVSGDGELGPTADFNFTISDLPSVPEHFSVTATENGHLVDWDSPKYLGTGPVTSVAYKINANSRLASDAPSTMFAHNGCTINDYIRLTAQADMAWDLRITPIIINHAEKLETLRASSNSRLTVDQLSNCPTGNGVLEPASELAEAYLAIVDAASYAVSAPATPSISDFSVEVMDVSDAKTLVDLGAHEDTVAAKVSWASAASSEHVLTWSRADGSGTVTSQTTAGNEIIMELANGAAYDFNLLARSCLDPVDHRGQCAAGYSYSNPLETCVAVASRFRRLAPVVTASSAGTALTVAAARPDQTSHCSADRHFGGYCFAACPPPQDAGDQYRVHMYTGGCESPTPQYPNKRCSPADQIACLSAASGALAAQHTFTGLTAGEDTDYTIEVIAASECTAGAIPAGDVASLASFPATASARIAAGAGAARAAVAPTVSYTDETGWSVSWDEPVDAAALRSYVISLTATSPAGSSSFVIAPKPASTGTRQLPTTDTAQSTEASCVLPDTPANSPVTCTFQFNPPVPTELTVTVASVYPTGIVESNPVSHP